MPTVEIVAGPHDGGAGTLLYDVVDPSGSPGLLATSDAVRLAVRDTVDAPATPRHLRTVAFNGHTVDFVLPPA